MISAYIGRLAAFVSYGPLLASTGGPIDDAAPVADVSELLKAMVPTEASRYKADVDTKLRISLAGLIAKTKTAPNRASKIVTKETQEKAAAYCPFFRCANLPLALTPVFVCSMLHSHAEAQLSALQVA